MDHEVVSYNKRIRGKIVAYFVVVCFYFEYEKESTNTVAIIGGAIGGAALLVGLLAALLFLFKRKQKFPLSGNGIERGMTDVPSSHYLNTVVNG